MLLSVVSYVTAKSLEESTVACEVGRAVSNERSYVHAIMFSGIFVPFKIANYQFSVIFSVFESEGSGQLSREMITVFASIAWHQRVATL